MSRCNGGLFAAVLLMASPLCAYQGAAPAATPQAAAAPPVVAADPVLIAAENLVGRALFLRGFYAANSLSYDSAGKIVGSSGVVDWTLAAVNVLKATHAKPDAIELEGVRVAIRYNPDAHEFQRHPLNDEKVKLVVQLASGSDGGLRQLDEAFGAIFSIGIDPALQRSMPPLWRHYFDPGFAWPVDALTAATVYPIAPLPALPGPAIEIVPPILAHQTSSKYTAAANHDRVQGVVQLRIVVDAEGIPQRIVVTRPLGYGLDREAAEAVAKWKFNPALHAGASVASAILINIDFVVAPTPH
jgi:TonB family protein